MQVETLIVGQLQTNCYLVYCEKTRRCLIIDSGDDADFIINKIRDLNLKPMAIVVTHGHFDHVLAVTELRLGSNMPFYLHKKDWFLFKRGGETAEYFTDLKGDPAIKPDKFLKEGDWLKFGQEKLKVIETPGHTPGSISLYSGKDGLVFVGDVIFAYGGVGRTDFSYASQGRLGESIEKLLKLPDRTIIYPGHGRKTSIRGFRKHNEAPWSS